jgi:hypothetical protein
MTEQYAMGSFPLNLNRSLQSLDDAPAPASEDEGTAVAPTAEQPLGPVTMVSPHAQGAEQPAPGLSLAQRPEGAAPAEHPLEFSQRHALQGASTLRAIAQQMQPLGARSQQGNAGRSTAGSSSGASSSSRRGPDRDEREAKHATGTAFIPIHLRYRYLQLQFHDPVWEYEWLERWEEVSYVTYV